MSKKDAYPALTLENANRSYEPRSHDMTLIRITPASAQSACAPQSSVTEAGKQLVRIKSVEPRTSQEVSADHQGQFPLVNTSWQPIRAMAQAAHYQIERFKGDGSYANTVLSCGIEDMPSRAKVEQCCSDNIDERKQAFEDFSSYVSLATVEKFLDDCHKRRPRNLVTYRALALVTRAALGDVANADAAVSQIRRSLLKVHPDKTQGLQLSRLQRLGAEDLRTMLTQLRDILTDPVYAKVLFDSDRLTYGQSFAKNAIVPAVLGGAAIGALFF